MAVSPSSSVKKSSLCTSANVLLAAALSSGPPRYDSSRGAMVVVVVVGGYSFVSFGFENCGTGPGLLCDMRPCDAILLSSRRQHSTTPVVKSRSGRNERVANFVLLRNIRRRFASQIFFQGCLPSHPKLLQPTVPLPKELTQGSSFVLALSSTTCMLSLRMDAWSTQQ